MKKLRAFLTVGLITILVSCNDSESTEVVVSSTEIVESNVDTISSLVLTDEVEENSTISIDINALLAKVNPDTVYHIPFDLDSNYIFSLEELEESILTNEEVQYLSANLIDNEITKWAKSDINSFIEIDSMKLTGKYDEYLRNIDIGMMQESDATVQHKVLIDNNSYILLWTISYSTYEACPYASGTVIFGTFFYDNMAMNTATLGEDSGGGDAPYWGSTFITSQIKMSSIRTNKHSKNGGEENEETGEEIIEVTDKSYNIKLSELGFETIKED